MNYSKQIPVLLTAHTCSTCKRLVAFFTGIMSTSYEKAKMNLFLCNESIVKAQCYGVYDGKGPCTSISVFVLDCREWCTLRFAVVKSLSHLHTTRIWVGPKNGYSHERKFSGDPIQFFQILISDFMYWVVLQQFRCSRLVRDSECLVWWDSVSALVVAYKIIKIRFLGLSINIRDYVRAHALSLTVSHSLAWWLVRIYIREVYRFVIQLVLRFKLASSN
jgi:hypothetical protein